jgi:hypothetical protein
MNDPATVGREPVKIGIYMGPEYPDQPVLGKVKPAPAKRQFQACINHVLFFFFHGALQRVLVAAGKIHDLRNLCFSNLVTKDPHHGQTFLVNGQHDLESLGMVQTKEPLKHMHDKFHWREIIIQQHHLVQRWPFCLGFGFGQQIGLVVIAGPVCHHMIIKAHCCS